ncbi:MAG: hypothetical protein QOE92_331 [Chloroflexota bacterium]|nr:hypothetical protein [Chloroflexota bacterium]
MQKPIEHANDRFATVGQPAPDFSGTDLDGKPVRLADYRGHLLVMNFWASWCGPCRAEQPGLLRAAADYEPRGVRFLGITVRDNIEQARIYRDEFKVPYTSLFDQASQLGYAYQVDAPPSTVFIDAGGVVRATVPGQMSEEGLRKVIDQVLAAA